MAIVEGRLHLRDWVDKDGNKRRNAEVLAENVYFGDNKREGTQSDNLADLEKRIESTDFSPVEDDSELPF